MKLQSDLELVATTPFIKSYMGMNESLSDNDRTIHNGRERIVEERVSRPKQPEPAGVVYEMSPTR